VVLTLWSVKTAAEIDFSLLRQGYGLEAQQKAVRGELRGVSADRALNTIADLEEDELIGVRRVDNFPLVVY